jgi:hypothetical protein
MPASSKKKHRIETIAQEMKVVTTMHPEGYGTISMLNLVKDAAEKMATVNGMYPSISSQWYRNMRQRSDQENALFEMMKYHVGTSLAHNRALTAMVAMLFVPSSMIYTCYLFNVCFMLNGSFSMGKSTIADQVTDMLPVAHKKQTATPMSGFAGVLLHGSPNLHVSPNTNTPVLRGETEDRKVLTAYTKEGITSGLATHDYCSKDPATNRQVVFTRAVVSDRVTEIETSNVMDSGVITGRHVIMSFNGSNHADISASGLAPVTTDYTRMTAQAHAACMKRLCANIMLMSGTFCVVYPWHPDTALVSPLLAELQTFRMTPRFTTLMRELIRAAERAERLMQVHLNRTIRTEIETDSYTNLYACLWPPPLALAAHILQAPDQCQPQDRAHKHGLIYFRLACNADLSRMTQYDFVPIANNVSKSHIVESMLPAVIRGTETAAQVYASSITSGAFDVSNRQLSVRISACTLIETDVIDKASRIFAILREMHLRGMLAVAVGSAGTDIVVLDRFFVAWLNKTDQIMYDELARFGADSSCSELAAFMARLEPVRFPGAWIAMVQFGLDMYPDSTVHPSLTEFVATYQRPDACVYITVPNLYPRWESNNMVVMPLQSIMDPVTFNLPQIVRLVQTRVGIDVPFRLNTLIDGRVVDVPANRRLHLRPRVPLSRKAGHDNADTWVPSFYPVETSHDIVNCDQPYPQLLMLMFLNSVISNCPFMVEKLTAALYKHHPVARTWNGQWVLSTDDADGTVEQLWPAHVTPDQRMCSVALAFSVLGRSDYPPVAAYITAMTARPAKTVRCLRKLATMSFQQLDHQFWLTICSGVPGFIARIAPTISANVAADLCAAIARPWPAAGMAGDEHGLSI